MSTCCKCRRPITGCVWAEHGRTWCEPCFLYDLRQDKLRAEHSEAESDES